MMRACFRRFHRIAESGEVLMLAKRGKLLGVPPNIVTGFLGVGKTTAILKLLEQKPDHERWAVLVNEFGEIGVDGSLVEGQSKSDTGLYVKEVPGGCMCCTAGLPMQVALNRLLQTSRPQRLLIEPTGLGHPTEVMQSLAAEHYREVLSLQKVLTLVDARNLSDQRYTSHPTFRQQLEIADVIVANKADLYSRQDRKVLDAFVQQHCGTSVEIQITEHGRIDLHALEGPPANSFQPREPHAGHADPTRAADLPFPDSGVVSAVNSGGGFASMGWRFSPTKVFNHRRLIAFLTGLQVERMKAVFITELGVFGYNLTRDALTEVEIDECTESRIEIVAEPIDEVWEPSLKACLEPNYRTV
jgi:G3E family GTPase